ncbi:aspartate carbamoyltransferase catalytic subunit [Mucisphaera calidilacus]|uniref:Aspartate carbamoyltransferase n=1 Tax=Mucisphaera calidilacus TaxID=2527982 RepID=A0A518BXP5_9BACT|nr:aspartate carbamoyltransferase catalytic subunit [Mucisphaera calidilacus]QDU71745.1 Aspartate carbamoyltransferase [Mucisphaera calidilacus]
MSEAMATDPVSAGVWDRRHLLGLEGLSAEELRALLATAAGFGEVSRRSVWKRPDLRGCVVANLFFEDSTRTRTSFALAAGRLSADVLDFSSKGSSLSKGESLVDTAKNIEAMGVDVIVCRHHRSGASAKLAEAVSCSVINAGDGRHEHPTQGLLDIFTIADRFDRGEAFDLTGLRVAIVGDIAHSRVARSNLHALRTLGAEVVLVGPPTLVPGGLVRDGVTVSHDLDAVLPEVNVVNMLRVQFERITGPAFPSRREYQKLYGLTEERLARTRDDVLVMHPGPMNRGLEIDSVVADGPRSAILAQVTHGLAVRMACLLLVCRASGVVTT